MRRMIRSVAVILSLAAFAAACEKVPITGRSQLNIIPDSTMNQLGRQAYRETLTASNVVESGRDVEVLERVGRRISGAVQREDYQWRYELLNEPEANAFALPGGKVAFYTGILPILENEAAMAAVMGHEVAHVTAEHGSERLSQQLVLVGGMTGLQLWLAGKQDIGRQEQQMIMSAIGLGATVGVVLPYSRTHESEADVIGLMYMASAGYPPQEAVALWGRMDEQGGARPPEFLSTHPEPKSRQANLREWMPKAQKRYERNALGDNTRQKIWGDGTPSQNRASADDRSPTRTQAAPDRATDDPRSGRAIREAARERNQREQDEKRKKPRD